MKSILKNAYNVLTVAGQEGEQNSAEGRQAKNTLRSPAKVCVSNVNMLGRVWMTRSFTDAFIRQLTKLSILNVNSIRHRASTLAMVHDGVRHMLLGLSINRLK